MLAGGVARWAAGACRWAVTGGLGWSGPRQRGGSQVCLEEVHPFLLAVPAFGQVQGEVAAAVGVRWRAATVD